MSGWVKRFSLEGKRALVTGATKGIGFEACKVLAEAGADMLLLECIPSSLAARITAASDSRPIQ